MPVPASGNDLLFSRLYLDEITRFSEDSQRFSRLVAAAPGAAATVGVKPG
jgi:hypothetical protein